MVHSNKRVDNSFDDYFLYVWIVDTLSLFIVNKFYQLQSKEV